MCLCYVMLVFFAVRYLLLNMNPIKQKAYKIVRVRKDGRRVSLLERLCNFPKFQVEYKTTGVVRPNKKGTNLFAFETVQSAKNHMFGYGPTSQKEMEIWEVEAYGAKPAPEKIYRFWSWDGVESGALFFWDTVMKKNERKLDDLSGMEPMPSGTVICSSLKMLKKVELYGTT